MSSLFDADAHIDDEETASIRAYRTKWWLWCLIAAGWGCSIAAVALRGGAVEWFMAAVLTMIGLISGAAPALAAAGLSAIREVEGVMLRDGGEAGIHLSIARRVAFPFVWIAVREEIANAYTMKESRVVYGAVFIPLVEKQKEIVYKLRRLRRGSHSFAPLTVTVGDWLGLTTITKRLACPSEAIVVLPALPTGERMDEAERGAQYTADGIETVYTGTGRDMGTNVREDAAAVAKTAGIGPDSRPYRDGDSLRHMDWRSAAKGRGLQTKLHSLETPAGTCIVLDTCAAGYDRNDRLFDACSGWAALAAEQAAAAGAPVTLLMQQGADAGVSSGSGAGAGVINVVRSGLEGDSLTRVSELLLAMSRAKCDGGESIAALLLHEERLMERGGAVLAFTGDWRSGRKWGDLAAYAASKSCRLELFIAVQSAVPTYAMREQQKWLESSGVKVTWLPIPAGMYELPFAEEGGERHVYA
ncbi:DUF58 domain-containing protein [Paenibacillus harenae]|uniref:Uncharacterized protein (DUF58 family) n=1 Tax=Paenibacillus harenae TaxID=306543 RepID=A0ABT9U5V5_PAEHA|nr:DUF58 domain-containing protein [Paenibacillus harenae]MDQ0115027.1 uncharacterized protein (DUF58 family) [Paenibacillus harenae]